jgi:hypothetical protein
MPAAGGGNTRKRQRRKAQPRPMTPHGPGGTLLRPGRPTVTPPRRSSAFGPLPTSRPFAPAQRQAAARTRRAQSRIPARPVPHVPIIHNPSPQQVQAGKRAVIRAVNEAAGRGGSGRSTQARRDAILRELATSPSGRRLLRAGRHYARAEQRQRALGALGGLPSEGPAHRDPRLYSPLSPAARRGLLERNVAAGQGLLDARNAGSRISAGPADSRFGIPGVASINTTALGRTLYNATSLGAASNAPGANRFVHNALKDLVGLGTLPFVGGYELGASAYEASPIRDVLGGRSDSARALRLGKGMAKGIWESVPVTALTGRPRLAAKRFYQHPLYGVLDTAAGVSALGRTLGAGARGLGSTVDAGGARGALARAGSTVRPPVALTEDIAGGHVQRTYSKDLLRKGVQVLADRGRPKLTRDGKPVTVRDRGRVVPVLKPHTELGRQHLANRVGNLESGAYHASEKLARERAVHEATTPGRVGAAVHNTRAKVTGEPTVSAVRGRHERDIVAVAVQGGLTSAKHFVPDLLRYVERLDREYEARIGTKGFRHSEEARANRFNARTARKVLRNPRLRQQAPAIIAEAERVGRVQRKADLEKARLRVGEPERYRRAALEVPAIEHMGARHFTVEEHAKLEREAREVEDRALEALHGIRREPGTAKGAERREKGRLPTGARRAALQREYDRARAHRIAVSGRPPEKVRAHEQAKADHEKAHGDYQRADAAVKKAERTRDKLLGSQSTKRGQRQMAARRGARPDAATAARDQQTLSAAQDGLAAARAEFDRVESEMKAVNERFRKRGQDFAAGNPTFDRLFKQMEDANDAEIAARATLDALKGRGAATKAEQAKLAKAADAVTAARKARTAARARRTKAARTLRRHPMPDAHAAIRYG